jgi:hypothetical protein
MTIRVGFPRRDEQAVAEKEKADSDQQGEGGSAVRQKNPDPGDQDEGGDRFLGDGPPQAGWTKVNGCKVGENATQKDKPTQEMAAIESREGEGHGQTEDGYPDGCDGASVTDGKGMTVGGKGRGADSPGVEPAIGCVGEPDGEEEDDRTARGQVNPTDTGKEQKPSQANQGCIERQ